MHCNVVLDLSYGLGTQEIDPGDEVIIWTFDVTTAHEKCRRIACSTTELGDVVVGCFGGVQRIGKEGVDRIELQVGAGMALTELSASRSNSYSDPFIPK